MGFIPLKGKQVNVVACYVNAYMLHDLSVSSLFIYQPAQCGRVSSEAVAGQSYSRDVAWLPKLLLGGEPLWKAQMTVALREEETSVCQATEILEQLIISSS